MEIKFHSMRDGVIKTVELTEEEVEIYRKDYEELPFHNGFADFEDFLICIFSYNA